MRTESLRQSLLYCRRAPRRNSGRRKLRRTPSADLLHSEDSRDSSVIARRTTLLDRWKKPGCKVDARRSRKRRTLARFRTLLLRSGSRRAFCASATRWCEKNCFAQRFRGASQRCSARLRRPTWHGPLSLMKALKLRLWNRERIP